MRLKISLLCSAMLCYALDSSSVISNYQITIVIKGIKDRILKNLLMKQKLKP